MREKLIEKIDDEAGMRLGLVGLLVALFGAALAFTALPRGGYWIGVVGALLGLLGIAIHFVKHWRSIFHVDGP